MPPLDFPNAPTLNQTYTGPNNAVWSWDGAKWLPASLSGTGYAPTLSPVFTGNPTAPTPSPGDADTSLATTAFVTAATATALNNVGRNLVHNPLFNVAQRGAGPFSGSAYTADRWATSNSVDALSIAINAAGDTDRAQCGDDAHTAHLTTNFTGTSGAGAYCQIYQRIEKVQRLSGKTVTVSFWALASSAGLKLGVGLNQLFGSGGSPSASAATNGQSVTLATTWARYSLAFTLPSTAGKVLGTNGDDSTALAFWFSCGATLAIYAGNIGVQSGSVGIWGVQLEVGSVATPLEKPDPQQDLAKCQRFYSIGQWLQITYAPTVSLTAYTSTNLPVTMRAMPTLTFNPVTTGNSTTFGAAAFNGSSIYFSAVGVAVGSMTWGGTYTASADL